MLRRLDDLRVHVRRTIGFDLVRFPIHTTLQGHLNELLERYNVTSVLDVGANEGQFASSLRSDVGFTGRIHSFEPSAETFARLDVRSASDARWSVHCVALGDVEAELELHLFETSDWNSLHPPDLDHVRRSGRELHAIGTESVRVTTLDQLWVDLVDDSDVTFLKSDTQGHDLQVLAGANDRLASVAGLLLESSITTFYEDEPTFADVVERCADLGFAPTGFFPVTRQVASMALDTIDVCFVRCADRILGPDRSIR